MADYREIIELINDILPDLEVTAEDLELRPDRTLIEFCVACLKEFNVDTLGLHNNAELSNIDGDYMEFAVCSNLAFAMEKVSRLNISAIDLLMPNHERCVSIMGQVLDHLKSSDKILADLYDEVDPIINENKRYKELDDSIEQLTEKLNEVKVEISSKSDDLDKIKNERRAVEKQLEEVSKKKSNEASEKRDLEKKIDTQRTALTKKKQALITLSLKISELETTLKENSSSGSSVSRYEENLKELENISEKRKELWIGMNEALKAVAENEEALKKVEQLKKMACDIEKLIAEQKTLNEERKYQKETIAKEKQAKEDIVLLEMDVKKAQEDYKQLLISSEQKKDSLEATVLDLKRILDVKKKEITDLEDDNSNLKKEEENHVQLNKTIGSNLESLDNDYKMEEQNIMENMNQIRSQSLEEMQKNKRNLEKMLEDVKSAIGVD